MMTLTTAIAVTTVVAQIGSPTSRKWFRSLPSATISVPDTSHAQPRMRTNRRWLVFRDLRFDRFMTVLGPLFMTPPG